MLIIRKSQMDELQSYMLSEYIETMVIQLKTVFPDNTENLTDMDLHVMIEKGIKSAAQYQVVLWDDVKRYLECMLTYGSDFDTRAETSWAKEILNKNNLNGTQKMDSIDAYTIFVLGGK
jgi:hypothetical protein